MESLIAFALLAVLPVSARADGECPARPIASAESAALARWQSAFSAAVPAAPTAWRIASETKPDKSGLVCKGIEAYALRFTFVRSYARVTTEQDQRREQAELKSIAGDAKAAREANKGKIAEIDRKIADVEKRMKAAIDAKRYDRIDPLQKEMQALYQQKADLENQSGTAARTSALESRRNRDVRAEIRVVANEPSMEHVGGKPISIAGAEHAFLVSGQREGNPESTIVVLLGRWTPKGAAADSAAAPLAGRPSAKLYGVAVRVTGDPERARALLEGTDLAGLKKLLAGD